MRANSPGASAWYMRLVLERYLFEYLSEMIDPKHKSKVKRKIKRTKKEDRNDYWWQPGEKLPQSAPGLADKF